MLGSASKRESWRFGGDFAGVAAPRSSFGPQSTDLGKGRWKAGSTKVVNSPKSTPPTSS